MSKSIEQAARELIEGAKFVIAHHSCGGLHYEPGNSPSINRLEEYVKQLETALSAGSEKDNWIPVSEMLPENNQWVMVWNGNGRRETYCVVFVDGRFATVPGNWTCKPTHWQPLPPPPGAKGE